MKKRLIVCCDGTWNDLRMRYLTNVGRLVQCIQATGKSGTEPVYQCVFYDDGVGADANGIERLWQGGLGKGIDHLIYEAYRFICVNYEPDCEICLFGFSRGAFTVRSVAGLIGRVGIVPRRHLKQIPEALELYRSRKPEQQQAFKSAFSVPHPRVTLLGCWDTVGALGIPDKVPFLPIDNLLRKRYQFHDVLLGDHIERALHAVAIDELRKEFEATLMEIAPGNAVTQLVQHWFPGDHGCVGGGSWEKRGLSNRCLVWMIEQAFALGIDLNADLERLHDHAITDSSIFFPEDIDFFYGKKRRPLPAAAVSWSDIDASARERWVQDSSYRPTNLKRRFATELNALPKAHPPASSSAVLLEQDESSRVRVFARLKSNPSHIQVLQGTRYTLTLSRLQVWKDGDFDPCDILGWSTDDANRRPYQKGKPVDVGILKKRMIQSARGGRLCKAANWFELVVRIGQSDWQRMEIPIPPNAFEPYSISLEAWTDGELCFAANDLSSKLDLIDKFDNNQGWVWVHIKRS